MTGLIIHKNQSNFVKKYQTAERKIKRILGNIAPIEHVGSTAVTGLDGKGIIDVLIGLENEKNIDEVESILIDNGYFGKKDGRKTTDYAFLASSNQETGLGDTHIHLAIIGSERFDNFILLRDYLRKHPDISKTYSDFKYEIAKQSGFERKNIKN